MSHSAFFYIKQKPAYELRSSDWSSDVCSSDLIGFLELAVLLAGCCEGTHEISHCWIFDTIPEKHDVIVSEHLDDEAARPPLQEVCRAEVCFRQNPPPVVGCLVQLSVAIPSSEGRTFGKECVSTC